MSSVAIKSYKCYQEIAFRPDSNSHLVSLALITLSVYCNQYHLPIDEMNALLKDSTHLSYRHLHLLLVMKRVPYPQPFGHDPIKLKIRGKVYCMHGTLIAHWTVAGGRFIKKISEEVGKMIERRGRGVSCTLSRACPWLSDFY